MTSFIYDIAQALDNHQETNKDGINLTEFCSLTNMSGEIKVFNLQKELEHPALYVENISSDNLTYNAFILEFSTGIPDETGEIPPNNILYEPIYLFQLGLARQYAFDHPLSSGEQNYMNLDLTLEIFNKLNERLIHHNMKDWVT